MAHLTTRYQSSRRQSQTDFTADTEITLVDALPAPPWDLELTEDLTLDSPPLFDTLDTDFEEVTFTDRVSGFESSAMLTSASRPPHPGRQRPSAQQTTPARRRMTTAPPSTTRRESHTRRASSPRAAWTRDAEQARQNIASRRNEREALARVIAMAKPREPLSSGRARRPRPRPRTASEGRHRR